MSEISCHLLAGVGLGILHFGGLWLTVRLIVGQRFRHFLAVVSLVASSYVVRAGVSGLGFYALALEGTGPLLAGLTGFCLARACLLGTEGGRRG